MQKFFFLTIETSLKQCSAALFEGEVLLERVFFNHDRYLHIENLHDLIHSLTVKYPVSLWSGIGVNTGPGSYTGLRIGVSAAKGLAYALGVPLYTIDTLTLMQIELQRRIVSADYLALLDASNGNFYFSFWKEKVIQKAKLGDIIAQISDHTAVVVNDLAALDPTVWVEGPVYQVVPDAGLVSLIHYQKVEEIAYVKPVYL